MSLRFRVYYGDGSTYDGDPYFAPRPGVQAIVGPDRLTGRYMVSDKDFYWWLEEEGRWRGGDLYGKFLYEMKLGPRVVLFGEQIANDAYNACIVAAHADPDFPPKTARGRGER